MDEQETIIQPAIYNYDHVFIYKTDKGNVIKASLHQYKQEQKQKIKHTMTCELLENEYQILKNINHPNIIKYQTFNNNFFYDEKYFCKLKMTFFHLDLFEYCVMQRKFQYKQLKQTFEQIIDGIMHIHSKFITHNDIKPDNIFLDGNNNPILADFGCSNPFNEDGYNNVFHQRSFWAGRNLNYCSPEALSLLQNKSQIMFDEKQNDVFALGLTFFECVFGILLDVDSQVFNKTQQYQLYLYIANQDLKSLNNDLKEQIQYLTDQLQFSDAQIQSIFDISIQLLAPNPEKRVSLQQALQHPFFQTQ